MSLAHRAAGCFHDMRRSREVGLTDFKVDYRTVFLGRQGEVHDLANSGSGNPHGNLGKRSHGLFTSPNDASLNQERPQASMISPRPSARAAATTQSATAAS